MSAPDGFGVCAECGCTVPLMGERRDNTAYHQFPGKPFMCPGSEKPAPSGERTLVDRVAALEAEVKALKEVVNMLSARTSGLAVYG